MAGMTSTGLQTLRYAEIIDRVKQRLTDDLSPKIDLSEDSGIGILISTICLEMADLYEVASEVYDSGIVTKAEGHSLDELTILNGIYRYVAKSTTGFLEVTGDVGTLLKADSRIRATSGDIYNPREDYTLTPTSCLAATMYVNSIHPGEVYTVIIDNVVYSYTVQPGDIEEDILHALADAVNGGLEMIASVDTVTDPFRPTLTIQRDPGNIQKRTQVALVTATTYLTFTKITALILVDAEQTGALVASAGSINTMETTVAGIDSVYNRYDMTMGRDEETDTELRQRYLDSLVVTGIATRDSIVEAVRRVSGVSNASIEENDTEEVRNGLPAKSFKVTVVGGDVDDIAQAIWDTKPVGIRSYGTTPGHALDADGHDHIIYFFRPTPVYAWVKLEWQVDDEESLNFQRSDIGDEIKRAILNYGKTLEVGSDIIPNRILRYVYEHVQGIIVDSVKVATSSSQAQPPQDSDYTTTRIPISETEYTVWESNQFDTQDNTPVEEP